MVEDARLEIGHVRFKNTSVSNWFLDSFEALETAVGAFSERACRKSAFKYAHAVKCGNRLRVGVRSNHLMLFLKQVNWQPGQTLVITTTQRQDDRSWHRNEQKVIKSVTPWVHAMLQDSVQLQRHDQKNSTLLWQKRCSVQSRPKVWDRLTFPDVSVAELEELGDSAKYPRTLPEIFPQKSLWEPQKIPETATAVSSFWSEQWKGMCKNCVEQQFSISNRVADVDRMRCHVFARYTPL